MKIKIDMDRYEEAMARFKEWERKHPNGYVIEEMAKYVFPELAESEDERIRKALHELVLNDKANGYTEFYEKRGITCDDAIAYLEKQKEQKSLNISAASEWLRKNVCRYINSEYNEFHKYVEYDGSIDKERLINDFEEAMQKEQKSIISAEESLGISQEEYNKIVDECIYGEDKEQKPVQDWEEKEYVRTIKSLIADFLRGKDEIDRVYYQKIYDWLDGRHIEQQPFILSDTGCSKMGTKMPEYCLNVKPEGWSGVDEFRLDQTIDVCDRNGYPILSKWLKGLLGRITPQSSWRPSEKQMYALARAKGGFPDDNEHLRSLYEQLKKL